MNKLFEKVGKFKNKEDISLEFAKNEMERAENHYKEVHPKDDCMMNGCMENFTLSDGWTYSSMILDDLIAKKPSKYGGEQ